MAAFIHSRLSAMSADIFNMGGAGGNQLACVGAMLYPLSYREGVYYNCDTGSISAMLWTVQDHTSQMHLHTSNTNK